MRAPIRIRASSLADLFDCPARWIAIHLESRRVVQSGKAALGTAIHAGTAVYDTERVAGHVPSISAATDAAMESIRNPREETDWDEERNKAEAIAVSLTAKYCEHESPKHEFVAVEAAIENLHIEDLGVLLTGNVDRVRQKDGEFGITDLKSGKQAVNTEGRANTSGHAAQLGVYELIGQAATNLPITLPAQIIGLQTNLTPDKQRIGTGEIYGARDVLLGDDEHTGLLVMAARLVHGETDPWGNPQSMVCHERYCPAFKTCFWRR